MKSFILIILLFGNIYTHCFGNYILCIDGGGSKTALQIVDTQGTVLLLTKRGITTQTIEAASSKMSAVGLDGVKSVLHDLIDDITIEDGKVLHDVLSTCYVVAGMAGIGMGDAKNAVIKLFEELGIDKNHLLLTTDANLALHLVHGNGAILIAGTGSICLGKKGNERYRVGGLGYLLGDEGSGYFIGLQALKVALAHEYGWGKPTSLTSQLCKLYNVTQLKNVMQDLYADKIMSVQKVGRAAPIVIAQAAAQDIQAITIVNDAATQLLDLITTMVTIGDLSDCEVHLWGGLFKSNAADIFIKTIEQNSVIQQRRITIVNQAWQNATTLFVQQNLCSVFGLQELSWQAAQALLAL